MNEAAEAAPEPVDAPTEAPSADTPAEAPAEVSPTEAPSGGDRWGDWRADITGGTPDPTLDRFDSPKAMYESYNAMRKQLSSGELTKKLSDEPSEEELASYRKDMGIPETHEGYEYSLPEGFTFGEADQQASSVLLEKLHANNASPKLVQDVMTLYAETVQAQTEQLVEKDHHDRQNFEDTMRNEWGADYTKNINIAKNFLQSQTPEVQDIILNGRAADGTALMNNPHFARWVTNMVLEVNPAASVVQMTGRDSVQGVEDRLAELNAEMKADYTAWRSDANKHKRDEYDKLLEVQSKINARK